MNAVSFPSCACIGTPSWAICCGKPKAGPEPTLSDDLAELLASIRTRAQLRAAHRAECGKIPCERCELWVCATCKGPSENAADDRDGQKRPALCDKCSRVWDRRKLLERATKSIPENFGWASPSDEAARKLMAKRVPSYRALRSRMVALVDKDGQTARSAVLAGQSGAGKTSAACYLLRFVIERGAALEAPREHLEAAKGALFVPARELASARSQMALGKGEAPIVDMAMRASFLVVDDLGAEADAGRQTVIDVVASRYDRGAATWVTTWLSREEFVARYGGGTERRLVESGTWLDFERGAA